MYNRLLKMMERSVGRTQCSPALFIVLCVVILAALAYKYWATIVTTLEWSLGIAAAVAVAAGLIGITVGLVRWNRSRPLPAKIAAGPATAKKSMLADAEALADESVQLVASPEGIAVKGKATQK